VHAGVERGAGLQLRHGLPGCFGAELTGDGALERLSGGQAKLGFFPDGLVGFFGALDADADETAEILPVAGALDAQVVPDGVDGLHEVVTQMLDVAWGWGDAQTLFTARDGGVVDGLHVDAVLLEELVGGLFGDLGVADQERDNVGWVGDDGDVQLLQRGLDRAGVQLLEDPVAGLLRLVLDGRVGTSHGGGGQRGGEDEARGQRTDGVYQSRRAGNVAADTAVGLAQSTSDDINAVHDSALGTLRRSSVLRSVDIIVEMLSDTGSVRTIHADGMHFIQKSDGTVLISEILYLFNRSNRAAHAVNRLKRDYLGHMRRQRSELGFQVFQVVVLEDHLLCTRVTDTLDHRCVVQTVGQNHAVRHLAAEGSKRGVISHEARAEDQRGLLSVQLGKRILQGDGVLVVARDVPGTTGTGTVGIQGTVHGLQNLRIAAHAEIVIRAPDRHTLLLRGGVGPREFLGQPVDVVEVAVRLVLVLLL